jgi:RHS repeat-associated protein
VRGATDTQVPPQPILPTVRDYYPFGLDALAGADAERMRFAGHERDTRATLSQTDDLDYMHARYYSPVVGRFLSVDPSRSFTIFGPQSFNLYTYVGNNPVGYVDPLGLRPEVIDGKVASDVVVVSDASQEDTAAEADRRRESAKRAEAELGRMRLRSGPSSTESSFGQQLFGAFTNNRLPTIVRGLADSNWMDPFGRHVLYDVADLLPTDLPGFGLLALTFTPGGAASRVGLTGRRLFAAAAADGLTAQEFIALYRRGSIHGEFPGQYLRASLAEIAAASRAGKAEARKAMKLLNDSRFAK